MDNAYSWNDVAAHIGHCEDGCWIWDGSPLEGNLYRIIAEVYGAPLPAGQKPYCMPECALGKECVNPHHLGTGSDFVLATKRQRQRAVPEPPR